MNYHSSLSVTLIMIIYYAFDCVANLNDAQFGGRFAPLESAALDLKGIHLAVRVAELL